MPGILGARASIITASMADKATLYGDNAGAVFGEVGDGRSAGKQAAMQLAALLVTLLIAIVGGLITGKICQQKNLDRPKLLFNDTTHFNLPDDGPLIPDALDISIGEPVPQNAQLPPTAVYS